jgi:hypothetical protein
MPEPFKAVTHVTFHYMASSLARLFSSEQDEAPSAHEPRFGRKTPQDLLTGMGLGRQANQQGKPGRPMRHTAPMYADAAALYDLLNP